MKAKKELILRLLDGHRLMALATNRPDGWPQVTSVGYLNDSFLLYCFIARDSQKHANILGDPRVSIAICSDIHDPWRIRGLSVAGRAAVVTDTHEFEHASRLRAQRYPEYVEISPSRRHEGAAARIASQPSPDLVVLLRITPELFSLVDYSKGFGHSDIVAFSERDLDVHVASLRHRWNAVGP